LPRGGFGGDIVVCNMAATGPQLPNITAFFWAICTKKKQAGKKPQTTNPALQKSANSRRVAIVFQRNQNASQRRIS